MSFEVAIESEDDSDETRIYEHWLAVMQFIHDNQNISIDGYTVKIQGMYGNTFSFDISFEPEVWTAPGQVVKNIEEVKAKSVEDLFKDQLLVELTHIIEHNLGSMWVCPSHVPQFGGKQTLLYESMICMSMNGEMFPSALLSLLCLQTILKFGLSLSLRTLKQWRGFNGWKRIGPEEFRSRLGVSMR